MSLRNATSWIGLSFCCLALLTFGVGCNNDAGAPATGDPAHSDHDHDHDGDHDHSHDGAKTDSPEAIEAALAKLSDEDRALAEEQAICPVGGEKLGSMGTPIKLTVEDRVVFICCEGCEKPLREDPEKYFAKLDAA